MTSLNEAASKYAQDLSLAQDTGVAAEPEAQLTVPIHDLLIAVASAADLGDVRLLREAQLRGVRPDFAALVDGRPCGWVELKAPNHSLDGPSWRGREKKQWQLLAELDALVVTNGHSAVFYRSGEEVKTADLPVDGPDGWDPAPLMALMRLFTSSRPAAISRVSELSARLAPLARLLRERIEVGLEAPTLRQPVARAWEAWRIHVHEGANEKAFANDLAQVIAYSLAIAALRGDADTNRDNHITLTEARDVLRGPNDVLAAALGPALDVPGLLEELAPEVGAIERLASVVDPVRISRSRDSRGEPWLWFYEDFLAKFDPAARKEAGVYYTPVDVVRCQVNLSDYILREILGKPLSFGDPKVVTLDPATGSGTYPLAVLDRAADVAKQERGIAGPRQVSRALAQNLIAFELLPGPYAVAHLRIGQRLAELAETLTPPEHVRVYLTDTLDDPDSEVPMLGLWGDVAVLAQERAKASQVKRQQPVTVVMGNPPYARRSAAAGGGWVVHPAHGRSLFADVIEPAQASGVVFSAQASLYNDYVYFWRWALWKAFEQDPGRPAVVSFITGSSWLNGPAFRGLRALARQFADEMWIVDLGGEGRGANQEENVFAIQTPVAIVTLYRRGKTKRAPATVHYRRLRGTAAKKLSAVSEVRAPAEQPDEWQILEVAPEAPVIPETGDAAWLAMPALADLFPWQQPGCKLNRAWPIAPSRAVLRERWRTLLNKEDAVERAELFVTGSSGRNIHTKVGDLPKLSELPTGASSQPIVRYGYRPFDRQWTFEDPRLAKTESPSLWATRSDRQVFLSTMTTTPLGTGPALTVATAVPDLHHFRGSYGGKDIVPLYRDANARHANLPAGLLDQLATRFRRPVSPEDLAAYVYALLAHPGYFETFRVPLGSPGPRVPLTADPNLFAEAVSLGGQLLWLQTYAERFHASGRSSRVPPVSGLGWARSVSTIPADVGEVHYARDTETIHVGDGQVTGVIPEVWEFSVSGYPVVERWLGFRTAKGIGRSSSPKYATPLDRIRPTEWEDEWNDELLDLLRVLTHTVRIRPEQSELLARVLSGELIPASELPTPSPEERAVPKT